MRRRAGRTGSLPRALVASVAIHVAAVGVMWAGAAGGAPRPEPVMRVYKVDIVSPPANVLGEPPAEAPAPAEAAQAVRAEAPPETPAETEPAPAEPTPPARPTTSVERPAPAPPAKTPATPPRSTPPPAATRPETPATRPPRTGATPSAGTGTAPVPATGRTPVATSAGGEGLNVRTDGADFVDRAYLENIIRQVNRYFRRPPDARSDQAEVRFWIERDGSVVEMRVLRASGSLAFRAAAMEAVEQAGERGAFGPLPRAYPGDRLAVSFYFRPAQ